MGCPVQTRPREAADPPAAPSSRAPEKKKLTPRAGRDRSQQLRRAVQWAFLVLNVWIGVEFYLWVRYFETGGRGIAVERPPGVEGWLPIASLMNLKAWLLTGEIPAVHPAGMFLLAAFLTMSLLLRKGFCSWLCPVGTISEWLWKLGRSTFGRNFRLPRWADIPLRGLKYILLGLFLWAVGSMSAAAIRAFLDGPYGIIADVKMLNFFRYLSVTAAVTLGVLALLSIFIQNFWCRYLCPYGALLGLLARLSPVKIRRRADACIDCGKCAAACPSWIPVDRLASVRTPECTGCYECIAVCPVESALEMSAVGRRRLPAWAFAAGIAAVFFGFVLYAQLAGHWHTDLPDEVYFRLVPRAHEFSHP